MISVGIDIEDISRFQDKTLENNSKFLKRIFTDKELDYCFKNRDFAPHLTARYCAKEAFVKAVSNLYNKTVSYSSVEVAKCENGSVVIDIHIDELKKYKYSLSFSHEKDKAIAIVIVEY